MRDDLEQKIMNRFSWFEAKNVWTGEKLGFPFPCAHGDGWYKLIYDCMDEIENLYEEKGANIDTLIIEQIKEKFGGLRVYLSNYIDGVDDIITKYENKCYEVCEICGDVGKLRRNGGWYRTVCDACAEKYGYEDV